jgi:predicted transcriptional regulator of viral defense system
MGIVSSTAAGYIYLAAFHQSFMTKPRTTWQRRALEFFEELAQSTQRVFTREQIGGVLADQGEEFKVPKSLTQQRFIDFLITEGELRVVKLTSEPVSAKKAASSGEGGPPSSYSPFTRYTWRQASPYEMALSLRGGSYLSHASAVFLHGLTTQIARTVYVNKEQSPKPAPKGPLTQEGIDRAFTNSPRQSQYVYAFEGSRMVLLSGKNTGNLEVSEIPGPSKIPVSATKLERTLIDIAVRPAYAGGVFEVLAAYQGARGRASVATLLATLKRLGHMYPYHQAIGFYMQRAGYPQAQLDRVRALGLRYDFYLTYQMPRPQFDPEWRVYYPAGLEAATA